MSGKIKIHLMMLITFMLCNASSMVLAVDTARVTKEDMNVPQESVVSAELRFEGDVVEMLPPEKAAREAASLRGKRFEWLGQAGKGIAEEVRLDTVDLALDFDVISVN